MENIEQDEWIGSLSSKIVGVKVFQVIKLKKQEVVVEEQEVEIEIWGARQLLSMTNSEL